MSKQPTMYFIRRRFEQIVAPAMGWSVAPFYVNRLPQHGAVQIEKVYGGRWRVVQLCTDSTGERNLSDAFTKSELLAWMDGILKGAQRKDASICATEFRHNFSVQQEGGICIKCGEIWRSL